MSNDFVNLQGPTGIKMYGDYGIVQYGDDTRLVVAFYNKAVLDPIATKDHGTPIHKNVVHVRIHPPGERLNVVDRPINDGDPVRFPHQWSKFLQKQEQIPEGTPIDLLFPNFPDKSENLKAHGVYTVQQCANLSAHAIDTIGMGAQEYVNMAKRYLESAGKGVEFHKLQSRINELEQKNDTSARQFQELLAQHNALLNYIKDPAKNGINPPWVKGHDAQQARIDANHPTTEIASKNKKVGKNKQSDAPPADEVEQVNMAD